MYKVVLWDIDGTLLDFKAAEAAAIRNLFVEFGFGQCSDTMLEDYSLINRKYWQMLEKGELTKPEILVYRFRDFFEKYGLNAHVAVEFNAKYQLALGDTIAFTSGALETVEALKGKVLQCAATNGTKAAQDKKLRLSGLDQILDYIFISDVIGIEKPNKGFFDEVWAQIGSEIWGSDSICPEEVIIIGDSLTSDIKGGINAGIKTCWFNPNRLENSLDIAPDYQIQTIDQILKIVLE